MVSNNWKSQIVISKMNFGLYFRSNQKYLRPGYVCSKAEGARRTCVKVERQFNIMPDYSDMGGSREQRQDATVVL